MKACDKLLNWYSMKFFIPSILVLLLLSLIKVWHKKGIFVGLNTIFGCGEVNLHAAMPFFVDVGNY